MILLIKQSAGRHAYGIAADGTELMVYNGGKYLEKEVIVRKKLYKPGSNFITSRIPQSFRPLSNGQYILIGLWFEEMIKKRAVPNAREVNRYFDPGDLGIYRFLAEGNTNQYGRYSHCSRTETTANENTSLQHLFTRFKPNKGSSVILLENALDLKIIAQETKIRNLNIILMEPLC